MRRLARLIVTLPLVLLASFVFANDYKAIVIDPTYDHDKYLTRPKDVVRYFQSCMVSFDGNDDDNGDGGEDRWGVPEFVAYEIKMHPNPPRKGPPRPNPWLTDAHLFKAGIAPADATYRFSAAFRKDHPDDPQLGYDRAHMCPKLIAFRMGPEADWNTHTTLNACPQVHELNAGIWKDLEDKTAAWADRYGSVWVICGPIVYDKKPKRWLGEKGEMKIVIPDAFFKIVVRESATPNRPDVLAFIYPNEKPQDPKSRDHAPYLTSVDDVETKTGLDFLTILPDNIENEIEKEMVAGLWE